MSKEIIKKGTTNDVVFAGASLEGTSQYQQDITDATQGLIEGGPIDTRAVRAGEIVMGNGRHASETIDILFRGYEKRAADQGTFINPLAQFKIAKSEVGESGLAEYYTHRINSSHFDPDDMTLFKRMQSGTEVVAHQLNRFDVYKERFDIQDWEKAFATPEGVSALFNQKLGNMMNSAEADERKMMEHLFEVAYMNGDLFLMHVDGDINEKRDKDGELSKDISWLVRAIAGDLSDFDTSRLYNKFGIPMFCDASDLRVFMTPRGKANFDINVLAEVFNPQYVDIKNIVVDVMSLPKNGNVLVAHKDWFKVWDQLRQMTEFQNPLTLGLDKMLHIHGCISYSPAYPAVLITSEEGTGFRKVTQDVTGLEIKVKDEDGKIITSAKNLRKNKVFVNTAIKGTLTSDIEGEDGVDYARLAPNSSTFEFTLEGPEAEKLNATGGTYINRLGRLVLQPDVPAGSTLTIKATSVYRNPDVSKNEQKVFNASTTLTVN